MEAATGAGAVGARAGVRRCSADTPVREREIEKFGVGRAPSLAKRRKTPQRLGKRKSWEGHGCSHAETVTNLDGFKPLRLTTKDLRRTVRGATARRGLIFMERIVMADTQISQQATDSKAARAARRAEARAEELR